MITRHIFSLGKNLNLWALNLFLSHVSVRLFFFSHQFLKHKTWLEFLRVDPKHQVISILYAQSRVKSITADSQKWREKIIKKLKVPWVENYVREFWDRIFYFIICFSTEIFSFFRSIFLFMSYNIFIADAFNSSPANSNI